MRASLRVLLAILLVSGVLLISCVAETGGGTGENEEGDTPTTTPISDVVQAIEENNWISDTNTPPENASTFKIEGVVTYFYSYYAYIVDEENYGIKLYLKDGDFRDVFESGKTVVATGTAYARDFGDAREYRLYIESLDDVEITGDGSLPDPLEIPDGSSLTLSEYGKYVSLDATYEGTDSYGNYIFDNGGAEVHVFKYSSMPDLNEGSNYELKGIVGQSYGYKLFIWDTELVTEK